MRSVECVSTRKSYRMGRSIKSRKAGIFTPAGAGYTDSLSNLVDSEENLGGSEKHEAEAVPNVEVIPSAWFPAEPPRIPFRGGEYARCAPRVPPKPRRSFRRLSALSNAAAHPHTEAQDARQSSGTR